MKTKPTLLFALAVTLSAAPAAAEDTIYRTDGGRLRGEIVAETRKTVTIETLGGTFTITRDRIVRIEREGDVDRELAERKAALGAEDADGWYELGRWAREQDLDAEALECYREAIRIDPDHEEARWTLGYRQLHGEWVTEEEYYRARGFLRYEGRWVTPGEKENLEQGLVFLDGRWVSPAELEEARAEAARRRERRRAGWGFPGRDEEPEGRSGPPAETGREGPPRGPLRLRVGEDRWLEAFIAYPRERRAMRRALARRERPAPDESEAEAALRVLNAYRYLAGLPDVSLDAALSEQARAAARICERLGRLDHDPPNPGLPADEYRFAREGASRSNLYGGADLVGSVHGYMDDSDPSNVAHVGHRRWCLSPRMGRTGFGRGESAFAAMYAFDKSRGDVSWDYVCYPARGYMPLGYIEGTHVAWSVSPNPSRYRIADPAAVEVLVVPFRQGAEPLELEDVNVSTETFGGAPAIIFRPCGLDLDGGRRYWVRVAGLSTPAGEAVHLDYVVEIVDGL